MGEEHNESDTPKTTPARASDDVAELLSTFSHDLSTPLANIKLAADVLNISNGRLSDEKVVGLSQNISTEADRLRRMIDTLVEWNRLEWVDRKMNLEWHLVEDLVGSAIRRLGLLLDRDTVVVTIEPELAFIRGDETLLETVLMTLLDNAAYFAPDDAAIEVRVSVEEDACRVEVIDGGPALLPQEDGTVDARFSTRKGRTSPPGGALGLVVSRKIIDAHGGRMSAHNRQDQSGAVFAFVLGYGGHAPPHDFVDPDMG